MLEQKQHSAVIQMSGTVWVPGRTEEGGASALPATSWCSELPHSVVVDPRDPAVAAQLAPAAASPTARGAWTLILGGTKQKKVITVLLSPHTQKNRVYLIVWHDNYCELRIIEG